MVLYSNIILVIAVVIETFRFSIKITIFFQITEDDITYEDNAATEYNMC